MGEVGENVGENTGVKQQGDGGGNDLKMANRPTGENDRTGDMYLSNSQ